MRIRAFVDFVDVYGNHLLVVFLCSFGPGHPSGQRRLSANFFEVVLPAALCARLQVCRAVLVSSDVVSTAEVRTLPQVLVVSFAAVILAVVSLLAFLSFRFVIDRVREMRR